MNNITLRNNQHEPIKIGIDFFKQKKSVPSLLVLPVAWGKSILIGEVAIATEGNLICIQPNMELLKQNVAKYEMICGEKPSIFSASVGKKDIGRVTYATIGSIYKIGKSFKELGFTKMVVDEGDRYSRKDDGMFKTFIKDSGITHTLGVTATPFKLQTNSFDMVAYSINKMLTSRSKHGNFFKEILFVCQVKEMIDEGYWSPINFDVTKIDTKDLVYNSTQAEFTDESIERYYETQEIEKKILQKLDENPDRNSILIAVPSLTDAFSLQTLIPSSHVIWGDMPKKERVDTVDKFKNLEIRVIIQVNTLNIGFDHPLLDCFICGRPTASLSLFYQMFGRLVRIHDAKKNGLFIDLSGGYDKFGDLTQLRFVKRGTLWELVGQDNNVLTGVPVHEIGLKKAEGSNKQGESVMDFGKYKGKKIKDLPQDYRDFILKTFTWNKYNQYIKDELDYLKEKK